jgi:UDPglucose--hexose-1-phosphate uridylyltransferase
LLKQLAEFEIGKRLRVVAQGSLWTVFCPFASRFAFQTWIVPRNDWGPYWEQSDPAIAELATLVQSWTRAVEQVIERPAYNVIFHNPPLQSDGLVGHCYVELFARIGNVAGFEWGSNCWINTQSPEAAADLLRERFNQCDWSP